VSWRAKLTSDEEREARREILVDVHEGLSQTAAVVTSEQWGAIRRYVLAKRARKRAPKRPCGGCGKKGKKR
jgi:hypothetical protein